MARASRVTPAPGAVIAALLACLVVGALLMREPLGRWLFPDAAVAGVLAQADAALARGDAAAAAARFQAAQARSPDHPRVAEGLAETRDLALLQAEAALARGALDDARAGIALAASLGAPGEHLDRLARALEAREEPPVEALLQRALDAEARDPDAALGDYLRVLDREPANALALAGRRRLLAVSLAQAEAALARGEAGPASVLVQQVQRIDPAHPGLQDLVMRIGGLPEAPAVDPTTAGSASPEAARWRGLAEEALGRGALAEARRALDQAQALEPSAPQLVELEARWRRAQAQ
jgi:tetratricopeptide (TPR) repeat protein